MCGVVGSIDPAALRQRVAQLSPGVVLRLYNDRAHKHKWHILICALQDRSLVFLINTRPAPFIQRQPDRLARHIEISKAEHPFLDYDCTVACDDVVAIEGVRELAHGMVNGRVEVLGRITPNLCEAIVNASAGSQLIAPRDVQLIASSLGGMKSLKNPSR